MHNSFEGFQFESSLDRAERNLKEAVDITNRHEKHVAAKEEEKKEEQPKKKKKSSAVKSLYGYAPELSRKSALETDVTDLSDIDEGRLAILEGIRKSRDTQSLVAEEKAELGIKDEPVTVLPAKKLIEENLVEDFIEHSDVLVEGAADPNWSQKRRGALIPESYDIESFDLLDGDEDKTKKERNKYVVTDMFSFAELEEEASDPFSTNLDMLLGNDISQENKEAVANDDKLDVKALLELAKNTVESAEGASVNGEAAGKAVNILQLERQSVNALKKRLLEAEEEAERIIQNATVEAADMRASVEEQVNRQIASRVADAVKIAEEEGYKKGFEKGESAGLLHAKDTVNMAMKEEAAQFRESLIADLEQFRKTQDAILDRHLDELTTLAIDVAEKVVKVSLKSSKDLVASMIMSAAETCRNKEWAKVYISSDDKAIAVNLERELIDALSQISQNVKVVIMEDEPTGTCIIETPDQRIDASADVQIENIRELVEENK